METPNQLRATAEQRPWGFYEILLDAPDCKVKRITVKARHRLSLQRHAYREEHWTIVSGNANVTTGYVTEQDKRVLDEHNMGPKDTIRIGPGTIHRIEALNQDVVFIEVQLGTYFGEDDIQRIEDDFGRE